MRKCNINRKARAKAKARIQQMGILYFLIPFYMGAKLKGGYNERF